MNRKLSCKLSFLVAAVRSCFTAMLAGVALWLALALPATAQQYTFSTLAGLAKNYGSADGTGSAASFNNPIGVAVDSAGNVYVADSVNNTIRKISSAGVVTTLAGQVEITGSADGTGDAAQFYGPSGVAVDAAGNVYVADTDNSTIRKISSTGVVTTLAGLAQSYGSADGTGDTALFSFPGGVAVDTAGNVYVADSGNNTIRKITAAGVVTTLAGLAGTAGTADGTGLSAQFNGPQSVAVDAAGNLYVADAYSSTIRKVTAAGVVTTLAGLAGSTGSTDGIGGAARFNYPWSVAVDAAGNVYVADDVNQMIRKVTAAGVVTTLAGLPGITGSADGTGGAAQFYYPQGVAADAAGKVYVADTFNSTIRLGVPPAAAGVPNMVIRHSGGSVTVSWPNTGSYTLQQTLVLGAGNNWTTSGYAITTANGTNSITIAPPAGNLFLRLKQ